MHEWSCCHDEATHHQLLIAVAFWITQIVSVEECANLTQNLIQIHFSTHSIILNVIVTHYTCSLNGVYHPQWLVQWSRHCSRICIPVHSPWLPSYINVTQIALIKLTIAGLFPTDLILFNLCSNSKISITYIVHISKTDWHNLHGFLKVAFY